MPNYRNRTSFVGTPTTNINGSSVHGLFDETKSEQQQQSISFSRGDRPASNYNSGNNNYSHVDDGKRSINMIIYFLVCMIIYIGFCFCYHRKKVRDNVDDNGDDSMSRRRENQVRLLLISLAFDTMQDDCLNFFK